MHFLLKHRYWLPLVYALILGLGILSWYHIPTEYLPGKKSNQFTIRYHWPGKQPIEIETVITRKVEKICSELTGVESLSSRSTEGISEVYVTFKHAETLTFRLIELRQELNNLERKLPESVSRGSVIGGGSESAYDRQALLTYSLMFSENGAPDHEWLTHTLVHPLERLTGVDKVQLNGLQRPTINLMFDLERMDKLSISTDEVIQQLLSANRQLFGGYVDRGNQRREIYLNRQVDNLSALRNMPVLSGEQSILFSEFCEVEMSSAIPRSILRVNGQKNVSLSVYKDDYHDALNLSNQIKELVSRQIGPYQSRVKVLLEQDLAEDIRIQLSSVNRQMLISFGFIILILSLFIRRIDGISIVVSSIVLVVVSGLLLTYITGYSFNLLTLAAITMSLGLVVDNSIIVYEELSDDPPEHGELYLTWIVDQMKSLLNPIVANTLTTLIVFLPVGLLFKEYFEMIIPIAVTLSFFIGTSVIVSLSWIPFWIFRIRKGHKSETKKWNVQGFWIVFHTLKYRLRYVLLVVLILGFGFPWQIVPVSSNSEYYDWYKTAVKWTGGVIYPFFMDTNFGSQKFKQADHETISLNMIAPAGTKIEYLDKIIQPFEDIIDKDSSVVSFYKTFIDETYGAQIRSTIPRSELNSAKPYFLYNKLSYLANKTGNAVFNLSFQDDSRSFGGKMLGGSYRFSLRGANYQDLSNFALKAARLLSESGFVDDVYAHAEDRDAQYKRNQPVFNLNPFQLINKNTSFTDLQRDLYFYLQQQQPLFPVDLSRERYLLQLSISPNPMTLKWIQQASIPLSGSDIYMNELGDFSFESVPTAIIREDRQYLKTISFNFAGSFAQIPELLKWVKNQIDLPPDISLEFDSGVINWGNDSLSTGALMLIVLLAFVFIWAVASAALENWSASGNVLIALLLTLGTIMSFSLFIDEDFNISHYVGALFTLGIAINNALLLLHGNIQNQRHGVGGLRGWIYAYKQRSRPIIITLCTTMAGVCPLIFIEGAEFWRNVSYMVLYSLPISTVLVFIFLGNFTFRSNYIQKNISSF